jgi:hypothetical protein
VKLIKNRPTQRAATVLFVKAVVVYYSVGKEKSLSAEGLPVTHHGVQDREEFSHAGSKRDLFLFASFQ